MAEESNTELEDWANEFCEDFDKLLRKKISE